MSRGFLILLFSFWVVEALALPNDKVLRIGHFATITHAPALVARALAHEGDDWYQARVPGVTGVEWYLYQTGNGSVEALHSGSVDLAFTGPAPLFAAQTRFGADRFRIVSGVTKGGSALMVQGDGRIRDVADFRGRKIATPAIGNTQDVACRAWLLRQGFHVALGAGDVAVVPAEYPDQFMLFRRGELDAAWVVEPWVSRFESELGGRVFFEDSAAITTVLAAGTRADPGQQQLMVAVAAATRDLIDWMRAHPQRAQELVRQELFRLTKRELSAVLLAKAWARLTFSADIDEPALLQASLDAVQTGLFRKQADVSQLVKR